MGSGCAAKRFHVPSVFDLTGRTETGLPDFAISSILGDATWTEQPLV